MAVVPVTTVTTADLAPRLGNPGEAEVARILAEAKVIVSDIFAAAWRDVPVEIVDECVYRVARAIKDASKASTGAGQVTATDAQPLRSPADPLTSSYPLVRRYVVLGI